MMLFSNMRLSQCIRHLLCPRLFPDATEETTITTTDPIDPKKTITEKLLTNLEAKVKSRDHLLRELQKRDKNVAQPLRRALSLEHKLDESAIERIRTRSANYKPVKNSEQAKSSEQAMTRASCPPKANVKVLSADEKVRLKASLSSLKWAMEQKEQVSKSNVN